MGILSNFFTGMDSRVENTKRINMDTKIKLRDKSESEMELELSDEDLSRHVLLISEHGSGKTNVFNLLLDQIESDNNKVVIFDPKGDYLKEFYRPEKDFLIGSSQFRKQTKCWNIFREIEFSDRYLDGKRLTIKELVNSFFEGRKNQSQPFFSDAAKDLFAMIIECQMNKLWENEEYLNAQKVIEQDTTRERNNALFKQRKLFENLVESELNNAKLAEIIRNGSVKKYRDLLGNQFPKVYSYLGETSVFNAGLSVIGEMQAMFYELFQYTLFDKYQKGNDIAMCDYINNGSGRLFIEYNISTATALGPIYKALIDMAFKTQMSNFSIFKNKCYYILDELKLVPKLVHLENGLNFGRSLGVRIIAGIQSIGQLKEIYGEYTADVLLDGFSTLFCFPLSGAVESREYVIRRMGQHSMYYGHTMSNKDMGIVDEKLILQLNCGQAICKKTGKLYPFLFRFELYKAKNKDESCNNIMEKAYREIITKY